MTYGFLNDWATTFTMNNDTDRGWVWRDTDDAQDDGAMSLTTEGKMTLKTYLDIPSTVDATGTVKSGALQIGGSLRFDGNEIITNTNSVLYMQNDNNGDLRVDATTLAVDASTNRVGIGIISPSTSLHINHPSGATSQGLSISNDTDSDRWHIYTFTTNNLALYFNGSNRGSFDATSGTYTAVSDRNLKSNIKTLDNVLDKVNLLEVVDYNFKGQKDSKRYLGFIAQDVEKLFPELVKKPSYADGETSSYMLDYSGFGTLAIKAIQEQQKEIDELKQQLLNQQKEIDAIKAMLGKK